MINSVKKPSTQVKAALNNFENWSIETLLTYDSMAFWNFNKPKFVLYKIKDDYWWNGLSLYIEKQGLKYRWGNDNERA